MKNLLATSNFTSEAHFPTGHRADTLRELTNLLVAHIHDEVPAYTDLPHYWRKDMHIQNQLHSMLHIQHQEIPDYGVMDTLLQSAFLKQGNNTFVLK